jgi:uncharacterized DUF497 family protein
MEIEFDPDKSAKNVEVRGLPFELVADFDFDSALVAGTPVRTMAKAASSPWA